MDTKEYVRDVDACAQAFVYAMYRYEYGCCVYADVDVHGHVTCVRSMAMRQLGDGQARRGGARAGAPADR